MRVEVELTGYPSTGYDWECDREPDSITYLGPNIDSTYDDFWDVPIGGASQRLFVFNDVPADTELTFSYKRPWETDTEPSFIMRVKVAETAKRELVDSETGRFTCCGTDARSENVFHAAGCPNAQKSTECGCWRCLTERKENVRWMVVCSECGNKRCPHGSDHRNECTRSNEWGQHGSVFSNE